MHRLCVYGHNHYVINEIWCPSMTSQVKSTHINFGIITNYMVFIAMDGSLYRLLAYDN